MRGTLADDPPEVLLHTVGRPGPGVELRLVDEDGNEVPQGTPGEIAIKGHNIMKGYYKNETATGEVLAAERLLTRLLAAVVPGDFHRAALRCRSAGRIPRRRCFSLRHAVRELRPADCRGDEREYRHRLGLRGGGGGARPRS